MAVAAGEELGYLAAMTRLEIWLPLIGSGVLAYGIGSMNLVIIASRAQSRNEALDAGSGNPGATNLFRTAGPKLALPVLAAELSKAFFTIWLLKITVLGSMASLCILPFVLGNLYPLFHRFKGGKGVAATVGTYLAVSPTIMLLGGAVFIVVFAITRRVSAGSLAMVGTYPVWGLMMGADGPLLLVSLLVPFIIVFTHRANIRRLYRGTEPTLPMGHKENHDA